ncbi:MAG: YbhB/YbcL family Raf kinase inhibitor-like protein [Spirosoma sp.]|nr:YbhB/YbcL family Raf kinase inhibitor-like protein [Spirosoma sp.]
MKLTGKILLGLLLLIGVVAIGMRINAKRQHDHEQAYHAGLKKTLAVSSSSFPPEGDMPINCTCKGKEASPALSWEGSTTDAEAYAVLMTDPDVPSPDFPLYNLSHWVLYNLPASVGSLPEGVTTEQLRMLGGKAGKNGTGSLAYIGPCPPIGRHAYIFRVYALDQPIALDDAPDKQTVMDAMQGHILEYGEIIGYFQ